MRELNRKISLGVAVTVIILAVALTISATMMLAMKHFSSLVSDVGQRQAMYDYLDEIDSAARGQYTIDEEVLRLALAEGYLEGLNDPYAAYLSAAEYKEVVSEQAGNHTGFGLQLIVDADNQLVVSHVEPNSPAALAGVKAGDVLTVMDSVPLTGASHMAVTERLANADKLRLTVTRAGVASTMELTANTYTNVSVEGRLVQETVGYIRIRSFNSLTPLQFKNTYNDLTQQGALYFVFDVRGNEGGSLEAVQEILAYLLPSGPYAACVKKNETETYTASDMYAMTAPTVTLVNGNTTGEAEFFAGVLQDMSKTQLVGTSTAGKAAAQAYFSLASDKAAVRLTVGELKLIQSDTTWKESGLLPDKTVDLAYDKLMKFELLSETEDDQLAAAIAWLKSNQSVSLMNNTSVTTATQTTGTGTTTTTVK